MRAKAQRVVRSALVPYSDEEMFLLVQDVDAYAQFLPWCSRSRVLSREGGVVTASVEISKGGLHKAFTTRNVEHPHRAIEMQLVDGPFRKLEGGWRFQGLGPAACKVELDLEFEFANAMLAMLVGPVFSQIANELVSAFHQRAEVVYGRR